MLHIDERVRGLVNAASPDGARLAVECSNCTVIRFAASQEVKRIDFSGKHLLDAIEVVLAPRRERRCAALLK